MSTGPPQGGSFSLFPRDRPPSRNQMNAAAAGRPSIDSVTRDSPSKGGRQTPLERKISIREGKRLASGTTNASSAADAIPESLSRHANTASPCPSSEGRRRPTEPVIIQRPAAAVTVEPPARCGTAFSEAQTLVRENSGRSRRSITKLPLHQAAEGAAGGDSSSGGGGGGAPIRSIFPEYDPSVPLAQQNYYPTQTSPTHIPAAVISRRLYSPTSDAARPESPPNQNNYHNHQPYPQHQQQQQQQQQQQSQQFQQQHQPPPPQGRTIGSPRSAGGSLPAPHAPAAATSTSTSTRKWPPPRVDEMRPAVPELSSTEQLRGFWKVANGWRAPGSEGRVYTLGVSCERDAPLYTLASRSGQPFYRMKLDPTSASAYVSLSRFDPGKPYKPPVPPKDSSGGGSGGSGNGGGAGGEGDNSGGGGIAKDTTLTKGWQEVLCTTLEETSRHHAPHDGLVALLFPLVAAKMAIAHEFTNAAAFATAERECARLVWDDDSASHFLVHPALAMPFRVAVERNPTWSRTEYTLEHVESPVHLARLTRDGTGRGWVEVDTGIAGKIDAVYLVDVAVAALVLVAHADGEFNHVEVFEPPPSFGEGAANNNGEDNGGNNKPRSSSRMSRLSARIGTGDSHHSSKKNRTAAATAGGGGGVGGVGKKSSRTRLEEFELDLESQTSDYLKKSGSSSRKSSSGKGDGTPGCARAVISVLGVTFKCFIWCATVAFKALTALIGLVARCMTSEKF